MNNRLLLKYRFGRIAAIMGIAALILAVVRLPAQMSYAADNTMAANTAYLVVPSDNLPVALWNTTTTSGARVYRNSLGIRELGNDMTGMDGLQPDLLMEEMDQDNANDAWYTISGMKLDATPTQPGLYIYGKRKVIIFVIYHLTLYGQVEVAESVQFNGMA